MDSTNLGEGMQTAVDAAFMVEDYEERLAVTRAELADTPQSTLDQLIELARCNKQPGLRGTLAEAYRGGDPDDIAHAEELARDQAETALVLAAARQIIRERQAAHRGSQRPSRHSRMGLRGIANITTRTR